MARPALLLGLWCALLPASVTGQADTAFRSNIKPTLEVTRARGRIVVDGDLSDSGWVGVARAVNFTETYPRERARPEVETEAWITYDADNLYVAILAHDDPGSVRSSLTDRDAMFQDDYVGLLLDTYGDGANAYELFVNPRGIQGDLRFAQNRGEDSRFDIIFRTAGRVTPEGFVVEMAIPFASLRFPSREVQTWRANFWRNRPRGSRQRISWAGTSRDDPCFPCQWGTLTGLTGITPGGALELLPAVVAAQAGSLRDPDNPLSGLRNGKVDGDAGITAKYAFPSGLTAEATLNPDFSQVESDAAQVDVNTTFALSFPERRPFFQEGGDLFGTNINAVYTRNINDPLLATKLIQRTGRTSFAYLGARDDHSPILLPFEERSVLTRAGRSVSNILRVRRTFGRNSFLGALLTDRRLSEGGGGSVGGLDGVIAFAKVYQFEFQILGSRTREPNDTTLTPTLSGVRFDRNRHTATLDGERFGGYAQYTSLERAGRTWSFDIDYYATSPSFRADNGFEGRTSSRRFAMFQRLTFYPPGSILEQISPRISVLRNWNFEGVRKRQEIEFGLDAQLIGQTEFSLEVNTGDERFRDVDFDGLNNFAVSVETAFSGSVSLSASLDRGEQIARNTAAPAVGTGTELELFATFRPASWVRLSPTYVRSRLTVAGQPVFSGYILRNRADLQFTRALFLRLVVQYDQFDKALSVEPLLTYRVNPFTLMYIGSTRGYERLDAPAGWTRTSTQYFAKFQYLIRR